MSGMQLSFSERKRINASVAKGKEYLYLVNTVFILLAFLILFAPGDFMLMLWSVLLVAYLFIRFK